jgi:hypothetical protein
MTTPSFCGREGDPHCLTHGPASASTEPPEGCIPGRAVAQGVLPLGADAGLEAQGWLPAAEATRGEIRERSWSPHAPRRPHLDAGGGKYTSRSTQRRPHLWRARAPVVPEVLPPALSALASGGTCRSACCQVQAGCGLCPGRGGSIVPGRSPTRPSSPQMRIYLLCYSGFPCLSIRLSVKSLWNQVTFPLSLCLSLT